MTFQDFATSLGIPPGTLRSTFSRHGWSIHRPEDVQKFLATRFFDKKTYPKRPYQTGAHLQKWQFVKKIKRVEVSPAEEKLAKPGEAQRRLAAKERKIAAVARVAAAEKSVEQAEKIRILKEKLKQNEAVVAAKERKIAALTRRVESKHPTPLSFGHLPLAGENETPTPLPRGVPNKVRRGSLTEKPEPQIIEQPTPEPEPNIVIPAQAGTQKTPVTRDQQSTPEPIKTEPLPESEPESPVAETAQSRIEPQVQQTIEQPEPQNTPPNPAS